MNRKHKPEQGECAYCGEWREITRDHIPPRSLFSKPRPNDLITVPSCPSCNNGASKHDEYFNLLIKLGIDQKRFPKENADSIDTINSLTRRESRGFASSLWEKYRPNPSRLEFDRDLVGIVLRRIVRGLFYHHTGTRLAEFVPFEFIPIKDFASASAALSGEVDNLAGSLNIIGGGAFQYGFSQYAPPDPFATAWLMSFYDHRRFFCVTS